MTDEGKISSREELIDLAFDVCDGRANDAQFDRIEELLAADPESRVVYLQCLEMHFQMDRVSQVRSRDVVGAVQGGASMARTPCPTIAISPAADYVPFGVSSSFIGSPAFSYLAALAIVSVGLLTAAVWSPQARTDIAESSASVVPGRPLVRAATVGWITRSVDCRWAGRGRSPDARVRLGNRYVLLAGLMEITYDTGATVILQGPATYEVESADGGYLSLGKLTAKVEKRGEGRGEREEVASNTPGDLLKKGAGSKRTDANAAQNGGSEAPAPLVQRAAGPLFTVHTPKATITDLGTEFGVKVLRSGAVATHVFRGLVEVRGNAGGGAPVRLRENESAMIEADGRTPATERLGQADAAAFVRDAQLSERIDERKLAPLHRWQALSRRLRNDPSMVAYYTFESQDASKLVLPNVAATGAALDGQIFGARWTTGRFVGKGALRFHSLGLLDHVALPQPDRFNFADSFTVAVWYRIETSDTPWQVLVAKGDRTWRLHRNCDSDSLSFDTSHAGDERFQVVQGYDNGWTDDGQWHLAVIVGEKAGETLRKRLYVDGVLCGSGEAQAAMAQSNDAVWIGNNSTFSDRAFCGLIDEVAILARAMTSPEIAAMYRVGKPLTEP